MSEANALIKNRLASVGWFSFREVGDVKVSAKIYKIIS